MFSKLSVMIVSFLLAGHSCLGNGIIGINLPNAYFANTIL